MIANDEKKERVRTKREMYSVITEMRETEREIKRIMFNDTEHNHDREPFKR